jgi:hypothetical protein
MPGWMRIDRMLMALSAGLLLISVVPVFAQSGLAPASTAPNGQRIENVITQGIGSTVESALQNAAENALRQVVGSFVSSETQVSRASQISDGIREQTRSISSTNREYSQGFIQNYEVIRTQQDGGIVRVEARVAVRVTQFEAYVRRLAEGSTAVDQGVFAQLATRQRQNSNAVRLIIDDVLMPVLRSEVVNFNVSAPQLTEAYFVTKSFMSASSSEQQRIRQGLNEAGMPLSSIVLQVRSEIQPIFIQNARDIIRSVADGARRAQWSSTIRGPGSVCPFNADSVDLRADGWLSIRSGNSDFYDYYHLRNFSDLIRSENQSADRLRNTVLQFNPFARNSGSFVNRHGSQLPVLSILLLGDGDVSVAEHIISRNSPQYTGGYRSADRKALASSDWSNLNLAGGESSEGGCLALRPETEFLLFLSVSPDVLSQTRRITIRAISAQ